MGDLGLEVISSGSATLGPTRLSGPFEHIEALAAQLHTTVRGEIHFDSLHRTLYATDASLYEIVPVGVVFPRDEADVVAVAQACRAHQIPLIPRGAGTGLAGGAIGGGVILDCSRHMNQIINVDAAARTVRVQPGVVLDELNAVLTSAGLHFAPDVATSSRATLGGMMANNSCGARSVYYGRTVDHVAAMKLVLADGTTGWCGQVPADWLLHPHLPAIQAELSRIVQDHAALIRARYPNLLRNNGGYGLDRLLNFLPAIDLTKIICGSEGTLAVVTEAVLRLEPLPLHRGLLVLHFDRLLDALSATPEILMHQPAAVELVDRMILDAAARSPGLARRRHFIQGQPDALLIVEFFADSGDELKEKLQRLRHELTARQQGYAHVELFEAGQQRDVWEIRKAGLGLLMSRPGDRQPYEFIEDAAVPPARLREYIERLTELLAGEGATEIGFYAHASVGCLHVRPVLNLRERSDVERMERIAARVTDLVLEFGGAVSGEHGDGLVRSCWLEKMYGPQLMQAFRQIKRLFDPDGVLNPQKIVEAPPMTSHLRVDPTLQVRPPKTFFHYEAHGDMHGLAAMCSGVGQCRQRLVGTMCPSYMATGDEMHTTRARANALRSALTNRGLLHGLDDPHLDEVMDLCISCKACKTECPTGVDMARLKAEWLAQRNLKHGASARSRMVARMPELAPWGSRLAPLINLLMDNRWMRRQVERRYGFSSQLPFPKFARRTFRSWWRRHRATRRRASGEDNTRRVVLLADTWTNHFVPEVGIAAVRILEASGLRVIVPPTVCCGRPCISKGLLSEAASLAQTNVRMLSGLAAAGMPIVGIEPSCTFTFSDEVPSLLPTEEARLVARQVRSIDVFLQQLWTDHPSVMPLRPGQDKWLFHGHCHQKAITGTEAAMELLKRCTTAHATEINSGCCGMAGSFGHETEHYDVSRAIGEQRLFPAVRARGDSQVVVSGFSCLHQIEHHAHVRPIHWVEALARCLRWDGNTSDRGDTSR